VAEGPVRAGDFDATLKDHLAAVNKDLTTARECLANYEARLPEFPVPKRCGVRYVRLHSSTLLVKHNCRLWFCVGAFGLASVFLQSRLCASTNVLALADLRATVSERGRVIESFRLEGTVCAVGRSGSLIALQDESATVLLELPATNVALRAGQRVAIHGSNCAVTRGGSGLALGTAPVAVIDGRHPPTIKSGSVFLDAGMQPLRVEWFNGISGGVLQLRYEGPELSLREIPDAMLWRSSDSRSQDFEPGVHFAAYIGEGWAALPDFTRLKPVATGVSANLDIRCRVRAEEAGLVFTGFLKVERAGVYTFHLESDDGARARIGNAASECSVSIVDHEISTPRARDLAQALVSRDNDQWVTTEGVVTFASENGGGIELELSERGLPLPVIVADGNGLNAAKLLHQRVRVTGICQVARSLDQERTARVIVVGGEQVETLGPAAVPLPDNTLTTATQIRRLQPAEARKPFHARIRGVVTMVTAGSLVLQDVSGGVFIHHYNRDWVNQPRPGELWEIEGPTDPGEFSPVIRATRATCLGSAALPEPIRPTWEQLMNGSLDAERVEIQGVVTELAPAALVLLTRDGKVRINNHEYYPLAHVRSAAATGSVVRVRGVFTANWDGATGQVRGGQFYLGNAALSVESPAPSDPFAAPTLRARELLLFTSHAGAFKRVKVTGQILYASPREYFFFDGQSGLRFIPPMPLDFQPGDQVEAVGFPRLGGPSPVLLEAQARKTGRATLPAPVPVPVEELPAPHRDSMLVQIEALLLSDSTHKDERVLEMQAGPNHFLARLRPAPPRSPALVRGSRLLLTGVYASAREDRTGDRLDSFELLLQHPGNIVVLQQGPWWTVRHTIALVSILSGGLLLALVWATLLRRTVALRTVQLKQEIGERQRVEQRRLIEEERARVAQDLHDELGAGLTEMDILGALAQNPAIAAEKKAGYLGELREVSRSLVAGLDEIVWAVNPRYDTVADLASYYSLFAQRFLNLAGITCRLQVAKSIPEHPLDSRLRHGIFLAFKEALNNVVRHSQANEVQLAIGVADEALRISVADNGRGFTTGHASPGRDGLVGMKERMQKLGGNCHISTQPGHGTTVEFRLPLGRNGS